MRTFSTLQNEFRVRVVPCNRKNYERDYRLLSLTLTVCSGSFRRTDLQAEAIMEPILVFLIVGAVAGWLAGVVVKGGGFGLIGDIIVGIVGAYIAGWLFPKLHFSLGSGIAAEIVSAAIGAVILLLIIRLIRRV